jgi:hypothetical protein
VLVRRRRPYARRPSVATRGSARAPGLRFPPLPGRGDSLRARAAAAADDDDAPLLSDASLRAAALAAGPTVPPTVPGIPVPGIPIPGVAAPSPLAALTGARMSS